MCAQVVCVRVLINDKLILVFSKIYFHSLSPFWCVSVCVCIYLYVCLYREASRRHSWGLGVTGGYQLPEAGAEN